MKKNILITALLIFTIFTSLSQNKSSIVKLNIDTSKIVIFDDIKTSQNSIINSHYLTWREEYSRKSALTNADINTIDNLLKNTVHYYNLSADSAIKYISADNFIIFPDTIRLTDYRRQYLPYVDKNGNRKVWLNIFCANDSIFNLFGINWKKDLVITDDGGKCYFQLIIDLTDKSVLHFEVNTEVGGYLHKQKSH